MKYLVVFLLALGAFVILQNHAYAECVLDPNDPLVSCDGAIGTLDYPKTTEELIPSPLKQMTLGIKLGHVICDSEHYLAYNIRYEPACVFPDSEGPLLTRGWAKLRLMLPAGPDPIKELELTGQNEMSYRINGNLVYEDDRHPLSNDRIKEIAREYSQEHHPDEQYLEYSIPSVQSIYTVEEKIELNLLEWGNYSGCWDLKLRITDVQNNPVYEDNSVKHCSETDGMSGTFHSYLTGKDFEEFVCPHVGYYRIEVSNGEIFSPQVLQNFVCIEYKPEPLSESEPKPMFDVEIFFNEEENSVSYFVVNGNIENIEIDIPLDLIDGVFMIYVNDQIVDDHRVSVVENKVIVNYGKNIESVKLMGYHEISGLEDEN